MTGDPVELLVGGLRLRDEQGAVAGTPQSSIFEAVDYVASIRGRVGYAAANWLLYGTGGFAWSNSHVFRQPFDTDVEEKVSRARAGFSVGAGVRSASSATGARDWNTYSVISAA